MQHYWPVALVTLAFIASSESAHACRYSPPLNLDDVKYADVVLVGRLSNYRIVRDVAFRRKMLANPKLPPDMRKFYEGPNGLMSDYALFDIQVDRVLAGKAQARISVTWDNPTFGEPDKMAAGPFLIALRSTYFKIPPLRGPSATILPNREPESLTVLQAPCSSPFIFESTSEDARAVQLILAARP